jgi:hypothetical protein
MQGSTFADMDLGCHFNTPSRKPSEHHCNANKKNRAYTSIDPQSLAPLCRVLFQDTQSSSLVAPPVNTRLLR